MTVKVGVVSLGCPKNLVDSEVMLGFLTKQGYEITNREDAADVLIVNTCGFIEAAKEESIHQILELAKWKSEGQCHGLIVTGCLAQRYSNELLAELPEIDAVVGTGEFSRIAQVVEQVLQGKRVAFIDQPRFIYDHQTPRRLTTPRHYAYLKIAEGCDNRCSYCIIPAIRGNYRSRPLESVLAEAEALVGQGVKEIILIAQDTTCYGVDIYGKSRLPDLLRSLARLKNLEWVRWLYGYPGRITDELVETMASEPKVCNYLDLPLQHADPRVLARMNRPVNLEPVKALLHKVRQRLPDVAIRTSFIVGFPGETELEFAHLLDFVQEMRFDRVGVFTYSAEENTPAASLPEQVEEEIKQRRYHQLMQLQQDISRQKNQAWIGRTVPVLIEGQTEGDSRMYYGRTERDAPGIDGMVYIPSAPVQAGDMVLVRITGATEYDLIGEVVL